MGPSGDHKPSTSMITDQSPVKSPFVFYKKVPSLVFGRSHNRMFSFFGKVIVQPQMIEFFFFFIMKVLIVDYLDNTEKYREDS
jgi:hypothetical protein